MPVRTSRRPHPPSGRRSRGARIVLASLPALLQACHGGGSDSPAPPPGPQIASFAAVASEHFIGEPALLVAQFSGGTGRIDPGALAVGSGQQVDVGRLVESTTFRLSVTDGSATVTRDLTIDVRYRERLRELAMPFAREGHVAVELEDGRILVIGGSAPRVFHTASRLRTGKVLVVGGQNAAQAPLATAELFE